MAPWLRLVVVWLMRLVVGGAATAAASPWRRPGPLPLLFPLCSALLTLQRSDTLLGHFPSSLMEPHSGVPVFLSTTGGKPDFALAAAFRWSAWDCCPCCCRYCCGGGGGGGRRRGRGWLSRRLARLLWAYGRTLAHNVFRPFFIPNVDFNNIFKSSHNSR